MSHRILLIEDDQWLAESYASVLSDYDITIVADGDTAIDAIDEGDYSLVIADIMLEKGLVIDLLHELQSYTDTAHIPVILCSSLASMIHKEDIEAYGVVEVLDKSILIPSTLRIAVQRALRSKVA